MRMDINCRIVYDDTKSLNEAKKCEPGMKVGDKPWLQMRCNRKLFCVDRCIATKSTRCESD
jgi:hypothetical protein